MAANGAGEQHSTPWGRLLVTYVPFSLACAAGLMYVLVDYVLVDADINHLSRARNAAVWCRGT